MKKISYSITAFCLICVMVLNYSCKKNVVIPTLTTSDVTTVTVNALTSGGNITNDGGSMITASGVCYGTTAGPTTADSHTTDGSLSGVFVSKINGLSQNTMYHIRAYATNNAGTAYGNEVTATTAPASLATLTTTPISLITMISAVSGGDITSGGNDSITVRGVCWATTTGPTTANDKTTDGAGTGNFVSNLTGLQAGVTYYVRAYATNIAGTSYGNELSFTTQGIPVLTTVAVTAVTPTTALSGGNITDDGGANITARGVCWSTTLNPTTADSKSIDGTGKGAYSSALTALLPATAYHVRAYATNSVSTSYGNDIPFTTAPLSAPTLTTSIVTPGLITAVSGGNITSDGGTAITAKGVCWATTASPTTVNSKTSDGTGSGSFISNIAGLISGTTYYVRAYATNSMGTSYGNQIIFNTKIADIEGNTYNTVTIGTQVWMAENLKTTHFKDNTPIPLITGNTAWSAATTPAYCWYANDGSTNKPIYGAIYNFYSVQTGALCPLGWHVPSDADYQTLESFLGMASSQLSLYDWRGTDQGAQMKNTTGWATGMNGTNTSGWSALPGGYRFGPSGVFNDVGQLSYWWTSTADPINAMYRRLDGADSTGVVMNKIFRGGVVYQGGKYVRCVK
jgi:uncharacterized protein (TIGR02145 family)